MSHAITGAGQDRISHFRRLWDTMLTHDEDLWSRLQRLFEAETEEFDLDCALFSRIDTDAGTERFEVTYGGHDRIQSGQTVSLSETYCRKAIEEPDGTLVVNDALNEGWGDDPAYETFGLETYVGTTVETDDDLYGTLCFVSESPRPEPITEEEVLLIEMYGQWATYELNRWNGPADDEGIVSSADASLEPERIDTMMDALRDQTRRRVLLALLTDVPKRTRALGREAGPENAETLLYHVHLPKLDEAGYVDWDREANTVTRGPKFHEVEPLLRLLEDRSAEPPL